MKRAPVGFLFGLGVVFFSRILSAADFEPAASAGNQLGLDLFHQITSKSGASPNFLLSPYSIENALALAYVGAEGETRAEMAHVLHAPLEGTSLQASLGALRMELNLLVKNSVESDRRAVEWREGNRLYGQKNYAFRSSFLDQLKTGYDAPFEPVDFIEAPESSRLAINRWVSDETHGKIAQIIPPRGVTKDTRLVLVNAIYFKAPWAHVFDKARTKRAPFHLDAKSKAVEVPMMTQTDTLGFAKHGDFTAVALPYEGADLQLLVLLPNKIEGLGQIASALTPQMLLEFANLPQREVRLFLPKLLLTSSSLPLGDFLRNLGMKTAFDQPRGSANFDRMAPRKANDYLALSEVFHQTFLALDEKTTEASAATGEIMLQTLAVTANPPKPIEVIVDHPFILAIQHRKSGACLFLGRIGDPR